MIHYDFAQCELSFIHTLWPMMTLPSLNWVSSKHFDPWWHCPVWPEFHPKTFIHDEMASVNWASSKHIWPMMGWWHFVCVFNGPCELNFIQTHWPIMTLHVFQWAAWTEFHPNTFIHGIACDSKWAVWTKVHNCHKILKCAFIPLFFLEVSFSFWKSSMQKCENWAAFTIWVEFWSTWTT